MGFLLVHRPLDNVLACPFPCSFMCQQLLTSTFIFDELYKTLINDEGKKMLWRMIKSPVLQIKCSLLRLSAIFTFGTQSV